MNLWQKSSHFLCFASLLLSCQQGVYQPPGTVLENDTAAYQRKKMVDEQIIQRNIRDDRVIAAMGKVPRHLFIPEENRADAYEDRPVPIGHGQTISQPYIVSLMTESLQIKKGEKILEIGTGSGYQAAILKEMDAQVYTIEIIPELAAFAEQNLNQTGYSTVKVKTGDGYLGWPEFAPFDAVIVTCAPEKVPQPLIDQLKEDGRMVIPVGPENHVQELFLLKKIGGDLVRQSIAPVRFVPMVGEIRKK